MTTACPRAASVGASTIDEQNRLDEHELSEQARRPRECRPRSSAAARSRAAEAARRTRGATRRGRSATRRRRARPTSVASAIQRTVSLPIVGSSQPRTSSLARMPPATNTIAAVITVPESRRETAAYARTRRASATRPEPPIPQSPSDCARTMQRKPRWRRRGVDRLPLSRGRSIAQAIVRCAEVRAALDHAARHRLTGKCLGRGDPWISWHAARALHLVRVSCREPVGRPLPDVPGHLEEAVAVRLEARDRRGALVAVELQVLPRELALPRVGHRLAVGEVLVAPREDRAVEAAPRCELPLGLARQLLPRPRRVRVGVLVRDMDDGMRVAAVDRRALSAGSLPVRAGHVLPPVAVVVQVDRPEDLRNTSEPGTRSSGSASG